MVKYSGIESKVSKSTLQREFQYKKYSPDTLLAITSSKDPNEINRLLGKSLSDKSILAQRQVVKNYCERIHGANAQANLYAKKTYGVVLERDFRHNVKALREAKELRDEKTIIALKAHKEDRIALKHKKLPIHVKESSKHRYGSGDVIETKVVFGVVGLKLQGPDRKKIKVGLKIVEDRVKILEAEAERCKRISSKRVIFHFKDKSGEDWYTSTDKLEITDEVESEEIIDSCGYLSPSDIYKGPKAEFGEPEHTFKAERLVDVVVEWR